MMLDVEAEAGWIFLIGVIIVYTLELAACLTILKGQKRAKLILLGFNVTSMASFYLVAILFRGGISPLLKIQFECNGILALCGIAWAASIFCFVALIKLLGKK